MGSLTIAEELLLLAWDEKLGRSDLGTAPDAVAAGAVIVELAAREMVRIEDGRLVTTVAADAGEPVLDRSRGLIRDDPKPRGADAWVGRLADKERVRDQVVGRLVERGVLRRSRERVLGIFPVTRHRLADPQAVDELRRTTAAMLLREGDLTPREAALGGLVAALSSSAARRIFDDPDQWGAALRRAKALAAGEGMSAQVSEALREAQAATMAAVTSAVMAATTASAAAGSN